MKNICVFSLVLSLIMIVFPSFILSQAAAHDEVMPLPPPYNGGGVGLAEPAEADNVSMPPTSPRARSRHSYDYTGMVAGDFDADGYDEIAFDYGASGIWIYDVNAASQWNQISTENPNWMIAITINSTANDELLAQFRAGVPTRWWNYSGYPGTWTDMSASVANYAYDLGDVGDGDAGHEVLVNFDDLGLYVMDYTGSGEYGGFDAHRIDPNSATGESIYLGADPGDEPIHAFADGVKYWSYAAGYPMANWTTINVNVLGDDNVACDVDGGGADEYICDFGPLGLWLYTHGTPGTWTRLSYAQALCAWPCAYDVLGSQYEVLFAFDPDIGLWEWNGGDDWARINWDWPAFALGANVATSANGGNDGEEFIGDFGELGVWIQYAWRGDWTRLNWGDPEYFIPANLDADPELELVFDFGSLGVWTWDQPTNAWNRINWGSPEAGPDVGAVRAPNGDE